MYWWPQALRTGKDNGPKQMNGSKNSYCPGNTFFKKNISQQHCSRGNSGNPDCEVTWADLTPCRRVWYQKNKVGSRNSTEYIRDQQTLQHCPAISLFCSPWVSMQHLLSVVGAIRQKSIQDSANEPQVHREPGSRATQSSSCFLQRRPLPPALGKQTLWDLELPGFCKIPHLSSQGLLEWYKSVGESADIC